MIGRFVVVAVLLASLAGCASKGTESTEGSTAGQPAAASGSSRMVKSTDGSFEGEIVGTPSPRSKFAQVRIGMREREVESLIGPPDDTDSHITGKSFIPFFFGGDTHRTEAFYKGEGILTYSPQHFAGEANTLIRIIVDPSERGFAH